MTIRSQALFAIHEFFQCEGIPQLDPNIMTSSSCEGAGEIFKVTPQFFSGIKSADDGKKRKTKKKQGGEEEAEAAAAAAAAASAAEPEP